ncbi:7 transmembrane sweet-taste receptor of 3 GCPR-domain-containing protein [Chytriomyces sp. MP71]|nr:7 transmembrane sweet-taste receptor of 3 GCPR-domain-containing protein [Chytriomyces sp. MP71]
MDGSPITLIQFATSMSFISLYNTSIGEKSLGYLTSITYHGDQLYGKSICDPLPNGSYIDPCGYGYCANLYPFQDVATQCICSYGYLNVKYDDCSEPMPTFAPSWTSYLNFLFTVTSFFIVIAVSARVFLLREMEDVKAMSLPCCLFVMGGFCLGSISILLHAAIPTAGGCVMSVIINAIAFGMVFSMLFLKSMRIFFIYRYTRMSRFKFLQDSVLISLAAFISLLDGALAAVYTHYSSIQPRLQPLQDSSKEIWICAGTGDDSPLIFLLLFNGALFFLCLAGGYLTRTAQTLFDESKRIGNMIYASTLILVCCLSLLFGLPHTTETLLNVRSVILGGTISIMCTGCPVILFNITSAIAPMNEISITTGKKVAVPLADFKNGEIVKSVALMFYTGMKTKGTLALWDTAVIIVLQEINVVFITKGGTHIFTRFSSCKLKSERDGSANRTRFEMTIENRVEIIEFSSPEKAEAFRSLHIACMVMNSMNALEDQDPVSKSHHPTSSQSPSFRSHFDSV